MNQNQNAFRINLRLSPDTEIVARIVSFIHCTQIWYLLYSIFFIYLFLIVERNLTISVIFGFNYLFSGIALLGGYICKRNLKSDPLDIGRARCAFGCLIASSLAFVAAYVIIFFLFLSSVDGFGLGKMYGIAFLGAGVPFALIVLAGCWFCMDFKNIFGSGVSTRESGDELLEQETLNK